MSPEDFLSIGGLALQMLFGGALAFGIIGLQIYLFLRRLSRRREAARLAEAKGTIAPPRFFDGQQLPSHYDALARLGSGGAAPVSIGERILRPAIGVRLFTLGLLGVIVAYLVMPSFAPAGFHEAMLELPVPLPVLQGVLVAAGLWGVVYIFAFEARYDATSLIVTRLFKRREYLWKDLLTMRDDGAYDIVLTFAPGGNTKVLKHSVGIEEFKLFAEAQAGRNRALHA